MSLHNKRWKFEVQNISQMFSPLSSIPYIYPKCQTQPTWKIKPFVSNIAKTHIHTKLTIILLLCSSFASRIIVLKWPREFRFSSIICAKVSLIDERIKPFQVQQRASECCFRSGPLGQDDHFMHLSIPAKLSQSSVSSSLPLRDNILLHPPTSSTCFCLL